MFFQENTLAKRKFSDRVKFRGGKLPLSSTMPLLTKHMLYAVALYTGVAEDK